MSDLDVEGFDERGSEPENKGESSRGLKATLRNNPHLIKTAIGLGVLIILALIVSFAQISSEGKGKTASGKKEDIKVVKRVPGVKKVTTTTTDTESHKKVVEKYNNEQQAKFEEGRSADGSHTFVTEGKVVTSGQVGEHDDYGLRPIIPDAKQWPSYEPETQIEPNANALREVAAKPIVDWEHGLKLVTASASDAYAPQRLSLQAVVKNIEKAAEDDDGGCASGHPDCINGGDDPTSAFKRGFGGVGRGELPSPDRYAKDELLIQGLKTVIYGSPVFRVNSDVGNEVVLEILAGKWRGSQLYGTFESSERINGLRISFSRMSLADGNDVSINAIGLDEKTTQVAVKSDVNRHTLYRYGWWGVGTLLAGFSEAVLSDRTVVAVDGAIAEDRTLDTTDRAIVAAGGLGRGIAQHLQSRLNRPPTFYLERDSVVGVFFLDDVHPESENEILVDPTLHTDLVGEGSNRETERRIENGENNE